MRQMSEKKMPKKGIFVWIGIIVFLVLLISVSFFIFSQKSKKPVINNEIIQIGFSRSPLSAPIIIALDQHYFKDEGLEIINKEYNSGKLALEGLFEGDVDITTVAGTPIIFNSFNRQDFVIIGTFVYSYYDVKILTRIESGRGSDLEGKTIAVDMGTTGQFFLETFLTYQLIPISKINIIDIPNKDLPAALEQQLADAITVWEPHAYNTRQLLNNRIIELSESEIYRTTFNLVAMKDFTESHPETIKNTLEAVNRATIFIEENRERSITIVAQKLEQDIDLIKSLWDEYVFELFLDQGLLISLADEARWAITNKLTDYTEVPNFMQFIYLDGMKAVKQEAVTIIH